MKYEKKSVGALLPGTFRGMTCRLSVECYPKTAEIKVTLLPSDGSPPLCITQNLGQPMPSYQAFLAGGILEPDTSDFMDYAERNGLGYITDFKRFDCDVSTGLPRRVAAVFQFNKTVLRKFHPAGCGRYERHSHQLRCHSIIRQQRAGA